MNRLASEKSPYLLQHARNPVDWYPWGDEAFERARQLDRPIFLSVGYSTCHWCHVMERESFENPAIAQILNRHFVSIGYSACHWCHVMERECFEEAEVARLMNEHLVAVKVDRDLPEEQLRDAVTAHGPRITEMDYELDAESGRMTYRITIASEHGISERTIVDALARFPTVRHIRVCA